MISAETNPERLIEVFNAGVTQFLPKPALPDRIREAVAKTLEQRELKTRTLAISSQSSPLIGRSAAMNRLRQEIARVVSNGARDILLVGETGTGKEVVAQLIAKESDPSGRLLPVNCTAISESLSESALFGHVKGAFTGADRDVMGPFELAAGGYVLLDEVGDMPMSLQGKLLRVLQERKVTRVGTAEERKVNFRCIAATHVNFEKAISEKKFREDLYYRIAKEKIQIPSLKDRLEDVPELVHYFLAQAPKELRKSITNESLALLQLYSWPGNVRQLRAVVEALAGRCKDRIIREKDVCQLLPEVTKVFKSRYTRSMIGHYGGMFVMNERKRYEHAIILANGNRNKAAEILQVSRATFFRRAKELGLVRSRDALIPTSQVEAEASL